MNIMLSHELFGNYLSKSAWLSEIQHIPRHATVDRGLAKVLKWLAEGQDYILGSSRSSVNIQIPSQQKYI